MAIKLSKEAHADAIASIKLYFDENMEEKIGNLTAEGLLIFLLEEIAPSVYNKAVSDVQERLQARLLDLDFEIHEDEFQYWPRRRTKNRAG